MLWLRLAESPRLGVLYKHRLNLAVEPNRSEDNQSKYITSSGTCAKKLCGCVPAASLSSAH